jgi:hypothetical protein
MSMAPTQCVPHAMAALAGPLRSADGLPFPSLLIEELLCPTLN